MTSQTDLTIAAVQMISSANFHENLQQVKQLVAAAANNGANMVVLPEYFAFMGMRERDKFEYVEKHQDGQVQSMLSQLAEQFNIWIVAGTHPIQSDEVMRPYGRCYVFNNDGKVVAWYDKIHLFDVQVGDSKGSYCESELTKAGSRVVSFESPWGKIGLAVCYDLRFPELFRQLSESGCTVFILPAAFTYKTGKVHWDILIKARAIENLCYFIASAQGGTHENGRETWGHSCIISPWGETIDELSTGNGIVVSIIDCNNQTILRKEFPVLTHKKL